MSADADVTVVVITRNRRPELERTLGHLLADAGAAEVIVVDNASTDGTVDAAAALGARVERLPANVGGAGRNRGVDLAATPYVAFSDDDSWWAPGALKRAADHLDASPRLAVVAGHVLVGADEHPDPVSTAMAASRPPVLGFLACGVVVRKRAMQAVGGFPDGYVVGGEEQPVALALAARGWDLRYFPDVVAHHVPSPARDPAARRRRVACNDLWTAWRLRPLPGAVRVTAQTLVQATRDAGTRAGIVDAVRGAGPVLSTRQPVPAAIDDHLRMLAG